jgi:hypothetical protein
LLAALVALKQAGAVLAALQLGHIIAGSAAMRADRTPRPNPSLQPLAGFGLVGKDWVLQIC